MWLETSIEVYAVLKARHSSEMEVYGSFSDPTGNGYHFSSGTPTMETEWGFKESNIPLLKMIQTKESSLQKEWDTKVFINAYQTES